MKTQKTLIFAVLTILLAACAPAAGEMHVIEPWARATPAGSTAAAYFQLHNSTGTSDALIGVSSTVARAVEIHENISMQTMQAEGSHDMGHDMSGHAVEEAMGHGNDVMTMRPVERIEIPNNEMAVLEPGGYHIMLIDLQTDLVAGESFEMVLHFENTEDITVMVMVRD
ncbi:MAG: copper chaperone PCu(A)C [Anaerolineales bacterium]|nr:copper chaperone PCu(A)C [Anaerolineales bacterium]